MKKTVKNNEPTHESHGLIKVREVLLDSLHDEGGREAHIIVIKNSARMTQVEACLDWSLAPGEWFPDLVHEGVDPTGGRIKRVEFAAFYPDITMQGVFLDYLSRDMIALLWSPYLRPLTWSRDVAFLWSFDCARQGLSFTDDLHPGDASIKALSGALRDQDVKDLYRLLGKRIPKDVLAEAVKIAHDTYSDPNSFLQHLEGFDLKAQKWSNEHFIHALTGALGPGNGAANCILAAIDMMKPSPRISPLQRSLAKARLTANHEDELNIAKGLLKQSSLPVKTSPPWLNSEEFWDTLHVDEYEDSHFAILKPVYVSLNWTASSARLWSVDCIEMHRNIFHEHLPGALLDDALDVARSFAQRKCSREELTSVNKRVQKRLRRISPHAMARIRRMIVDDIIHPFPCGVETACLGALLAVTNPCHRKWGYENVTKLLWSAFGYQAYSEYEAHAVRRGDVKSFGEEMVRGSIYEMLSYDCKSVSESFLRLLIGRLTMTE